MIESEELVRVGGQRRLVVALQPPDELGREPLLDATR
jgi:hypothetical protein